MNSQFVYVVVTMPNKEKEVFEKLQAYEQVATIAPLNDYTHDFIVVSNSSEGLEKMLKETAGIVDVKNIGSLPAVRAKLSAA